LRTALKKKKLVFKCVLKLNFATLKLLYSNTVNYLLTFSNIRQRFKNELTLGEAGFRTQGIECGVALGGEQSAAPAQVFGRLTTFLDLYWEL
jgi:hypothetical protein